MVIDLDKCTGCGACMAACKQENNVAVVSPEEANADRVMFWMNVVTTYEGEYPDIRVRRIPRLCFHCDNPPCTRVCPVHATYLNEEGLVGQIYHRCIGCRYCMAACPFTAKVFNWYKPQWDEGLGTCLNPDVSKRPAGVVEKCSFCSHRLLKVKEAADLDDREIAEGEYMPACAESCPAEAIHFGDLENRDGRVYELSQSSRSFRTMDDLGTEPKVIYLSKRE
jgi:molybdopterin-containing oxidoreductase family iron-sulfur binding subunit